MNERLKALADAGVSIWLDDLSRERITSGNLADLVSKYCVTGVTTNPTIFAAALSQGHMYDEQVKELAARDADLHDAIKVLTTDDVRNACDIMAATFAATNGVDGRVSIEVDPDLANETDATTAQATDLWKIVDRPNVLIKIPATKAGLPSIASVTGEGVSVNVTLIFAIERYRYVFISSRLFADGKLCYICSAVLRKCNGTLHEINTRSLQAVANNYRQVI